MANAKQRQTLVDHAEFLIANKASIGYPGRQTNGVYMPFRPMPWMNESKAGLANRFAAGDTWYPDCSAAVAWLFKWAGMKDPTGLGYDGYGGSPLMWASLPHYTDPSHAKAGAIVVYGDAGEIHAACVIKPGPDPTLFSHGSAAGPISVSLSAENAAHAGQAVTFLDVSRL